MLKTSNKKVQGERKCALGTNGLIKNTEPDQYNGLRYMHRF